MITEDTDMSVKIKSYDAVIINFYKNDKYTPTIKAVFKDAIDVYRAKLINKLKDGEEFPCRVLFAECDYSIEGNKQFLLDQRNV